MKNKLQFFCILFMLSQGVFCQVKTPIWGTDTLGYHKIVTDSKDGTILPWYSTDLGKSFDFVIRKIWNFWDTMRTDINGLPYYMNHQVWRGDFDDPRGLGGDQLMMALSSWRLLYAYSGNERIKENMKFMADYYLSHSLSPKNCKWPDLPYPYNTLVYSGIYDGDMVLGRNFLQPDKAGSFGLELIHLYKMNNNERYPNITCSIYLESAIKIANTLAANSNKGDELKSPLPFKVNAINGEIGTLKSHEGKGEFIILSEYTSAWSSTLEMFLELIKMKMGNIELYQQAFDKILNWMKQYPLKNNKWGPFFEDIPGWSDTQINAISFAQFIMNHRDLFPEWKSNVKGIFEWVYNNLGNKEWEKFGVTVVNEQTAYQTPGNSHTSREASAELQYCALTGNNTCKVNAIRQLSWATYMVDTDGKNCYPRDENWLSDGYGDYVRHFLKSMSWFPELAPENKDHILSTTSVIGYVGYKPDFNKTLSVYVESKFLKDALIYYTTYDEESIEQIRLTHKPGKVLQNWQPLSEVDTKGNIGWHWQEMSHGGLLTLHHKGGKVILISK